MNQGPPTAIYSPPYANAEQQPLTDRERRQGPLLVAEEPPAMVYLSSQRNAERQSEIDTEHTGTAQGHSLVAEEPPTMVHLSPQTDAERQPEIDTEHTETTQGHLLVAEEPPMVYPSPKTNAERQPEIDTEYIETAKGPSLVAEEPFMVMRPSLQTAAKRQPEIDTEHTETAQEYSLVAEEPPTTVHSWPQTNAERQPEIDTEYTETVQGPLLVAGEPPMMAYRLARSNAERQPDINKEYTETTQGPSLVAEEPPMMMRPSSQTNAEPQLDTDTEHTETAQEPHGSEESPVMVGIEDLDIDDIMIAVVGPTGSGKSTFVSLASGRDTQGVGHTLRSFTSDVIGVRYWDQESGRHVVLVDTPGFDHTCDPGLDRDISDMISDWLNSSYKKQKLFSGILYLHRITDNRVAGTPLKNLRVFRKLCGRDALEKVYLTTTMWDEVDQSVGEKRLEELKSDDWKALIDQGAQTECCRSDDNSAKNIIRRILDKEASRKALLLQEEMASLKEELKGTEAGPELYSQLEMLVEKQIALLQRIDEEMNVLAGLRTEYNDLRVQINDKLRQIQEPKSSRLRKLLRLFFWK